MQELGQLPGAALFADVAILGPVPTQGVKTPLMVSGPGSRAVADLLAPLGADVEIADGEPGAAMAHKLLRSVLMKGLASVVVEAVTAGRAAGLEDWIRSPDRQAARRRRPGRHRQVPHRHRQARPAPLQGDAGHCQLPPDLGVPAEMTAASAAALSRMAEESAQAAPALR